MKAEQIFELALQYGAEQPGITFDSEALLRYTRKVQEMEREACAKVCDNLDAMSLDPLVCRGSAQECAEAIRAAALTACTAKRNT